MGKESKVQIGVRICSAVELSPSQLERAEEHAEIYGKVSVNQYPNGSLLYSAGEMMPYKTHLVGPKLAKREQRRILQSKITK